MGNLFPVILTLPVVAEDHLILDIIIHPEVLVVEALGNMGMVKGQWMILVAVAVVQKELKQELVALVDPVLFLYDI